jgi:hypothetical protein
MRDSVSFMEPALCVFQMCGALKAANDVVSLGQPYFQHQQTCVTSRMILSVEFVLVPGKGKVHPRTGHEGPKGEWMYSYTLSLTSALDGGWVVNAKHRRPYPRE